MPTCREEWYIILAVSIVVVVDVVSNVVVASIHRLGGGIVQVILLGRHMYSF